MANEDGILNGQVCSGNGMFSQSAALCMCNAGWQVYMHCNLEPPSSTFMYSAVPVIFACLALHQQMHHGRVTEHAGDILPGAGRLQRQPGQPREVLHSRAELRPHLLRGSGPGHAVLCQRGGRCIWDM